MWEVKIKITYIPLTNLDLFLMPILVCSDVSQLFLVNGATALVANSQPSINDYNFFSFLGLQFDHIVFKLLDLLKKMSQLIEQQHLKS